MFIQVSQVNLMFSKKTTKFDKNFTIDLTLYSKCQIDDEDFVNFCGLLREHELFFNIQENSENFIQKNKALFSQKSNHLKP